MGGREHTCEMTALLAERVRVAESENAALRKRVEELETKLRDVDLQYAREFATRVDYQNRAEKAEAERDRLADEHHALGNWPLCKHCVKFVNDDMEAQAINAKLQADLDAALLVIKEARVRPELSWSDEALSAFSRIDLSKAEVKRG